MDRKGQFLYHFINTPERWDKLRMLVVALVNRDRPWQPAGLEEDRVVGLTVDAVQNVRPCPWCVEGLPNNARNALVCAAQLLLAGESLDDLKAFDVWLDANLSALEIPEDFPVVAGDAPEEARTICDQRNHRGYESLQWNSRRRRQRKFTDFMERLLYRPGAVVGDGSVTVISVDFATRSVIPAS